MHLIVVISVKFNKWSLLGLIVVHISLLLGLYGTDIIIHVLRIITINTWFHFWAHTFASVFFLRISLITHKKKKTIRTNVWRSRNYERWLMSREWPNAKITQTLSQMFYDWIQIICHIQQKATRSTCLALGDYLK